MREDIAGPQGASSRPMWECLEALLRQVWGCRGSDDTDRLRTVVKKLRHKLGDDAANPAYIVNVRRVGYRMATPGGA